MNTNLLDDDDDDDLSGDSSNHPGSPDTCDITSLDAEGNGSTDYSSGVETPPTNIIMNDIIMHHESDEGDASADNDINTNHAQLQNNNIDDMDVAVSMAYNDINEEVIDDDGNFQCEWFSTFYIPIQYMANNNSYERQKGETFYWKGINWSVLFCLNEQNSNYGGGGLFIGYESFDADKSKSTINIRYQFLLMDENEQPINFFGVTCK
jgi:hypothetical protein